MSFYIYMFDLLFFWCLWHRAYMYLSTFMSLSKLMHICISIHIKNRLDKRFNWCCTPAAASHSHPECQATQREIQQKRYPCRPTTPRVERTSPLFRPAEPSGSWGLMMVKKKVKALMVLTLDFHESWWTVLKIGFGTLGKSQKPPSHPSSQWRSKAMLATCCRPYRRFCPLTLAGKSKIPTHGQGVLFLGQKKCSKASICPQKRTPQPLDKKSQNLSSRGLSHSYPTWHLLLPGSNPNRPRCPRTFGATRSSRDSGAAPDGPSSPAIWK